MKALKAIERFADAMFAAVFILMGSTIYESGNGGRAWAGIALVTIGVYFIYNRTDKDNPNV